MNKKPCGYKFHTTFNPRSIKHNAPRLLLGQWLKKKTAYIGSRPHDIIKPGVVCQPEVTLGVEEEVAGDDAARAISQRERDEEVSG